MKIYLSHRTALDFYMLAKSRGKAGLYDLLERARGANETAAGQHVAGQHAAGQQGLAGCAYRSGDLRNIDLTFLEGVHEGKIDVLVPSRECNYANARIRHHVWSGELPPQAFLRLSEHVYVTSPEFLLLQYAGTLDVYQTIQLAMQLCGTYANSRASPHGMVDHPKLTNAARLMEFGSQLRGCRGLATYRKAVSHVIENAASTTEAGIAVILHASALFGGFGLRAYELNVNKRYDETHRRMTGKSECFVDMLDEKSHTGYEYQGREAHSDVEGGVPYEGKARPGELSYGAQMLEADTLKLAALRDMGYQVFPLVWDQVRTPEAFERLAREAARLLGEPTDGYAFSGGAELRRRRTRLHEGLLLRRLYVEDL